MGKVNLFGPAVVSNGFIVPALDAWSKAALCVFFLLVEPFFEEIKEHLLQTILRISESITVKQEFLVNFLVKLTDLVIKVLHDCLDLVAIGLYPMLDDAQVIEGACGYKEHELYGTSVIEI